MILYHGGEATVYNPVVLTNGRYKDFGYGFYCTNHERQAIRRALSKRGKKHVVSVYEYEESEVLRILRFSDTNDAWLDFVTACRRGASHDYDIVEGPMADDQIWNYVEDYVEGNLSREAFFALTKFNHPTHQIAFCTEKALALLRFERSFEVHEK